MPKPLNSPDNRLRTSRRRFSLCVMLHRDNTRRWFAATFAAIIACLAVAANAPAEARGGRPDAAQVVEAYLHARQWVDAFSPPDMGAAESRLPIDGATGVCVILRRAGRVVASATAAFGEPGGPRMHSELLVRIAVGRALGQVLSDPAVAALPEEMRLEVGRTLTLEVEVAGPLQPLPGRTVQRIGEQIEPGIDGLALRRGDSVAMAFPSQLRATNNEGQTAVRLPALAVQLQLPPAEVNALLRQQGVSASRFRTAHLAQAAPDRLPFETFRGDRIVPESEAERPGVTAFADGAAHHLISAIWPGSELAADHPDRDAPLGLMGDYRPVSDVFRPLLAPPIDQALASLALSEYAASPGINEAAGARAASAALRLLRDLEQVTPGEEEPTGDLAACAAIIYAALSHPEALRDDRITRLFEAAVDRVRGALIEGRLAEPRTGRILPAHSQAMAAGAMARLAARGIGGISLDGASDALDAAWRAAPEAEQIDLLPWIAWAEADVAAARGRMISTARIAALRRLIAALDQSRADESDAAPDVRGGFSLTAAAGGLAARPTAQSARPAAFLGWALRQPALVPPGERSSAAQRHRLTMRFLIQLSFRDSLLWSVRNPQRAEGGVRAALWDHDLPRAAQAMALLAAVETLRSLHEIAE